MDGGETNSHGTLRGTHMDPRRENNQCQLLPKLGLSLGHLPHILTVVLLHPRPTAPCPAADSPFSRERGTGEGVMHTGGTANQRLGERLGVLQYCVRWQGSNRGPVT